MQSSTLNDVSPVCHPSKSVQTISSLPLSLEVGPNMRVFAKKLWDWKTLSRIWEGYLSDKAIHVG